MMTIINYFSFYFSFYLLWLMRLYLYFCLSCLRFCTYMHLLYALLQCTSTPGASTILPLLLHLLHDYLLVYTLFVMIGSMIVHSFWRSLFKTSPESIWLTEFLVARMELDALFCREKVAPYQQTPERKANPNINHTRKSLKMIFLSWVLLSNDTLT